MASKRRTTIKSRHMAGPQQLVRVDREDRGPIDESVEREGIKTLEKHAGDFNLVIISDYGKGLLTRELLDATFRAARAKKVRVLVDPKGSDYTRYEGLRSSRRTAPRPSSPPGARFATLRRGLRGSTISWPRPIGSSSSASSRRR